MPGLSPQDAMQESTYLVDAESPIEHARLMEQDRLYTSVLGLLPDALLSLEPRRVLDIACGPGGWVVDFAHQYPRSHVTGIDISARMAQYAQAQAEIQVIPNVSFRVMNAARPLAFEADCFDLVHARLISGFLTKKSWPQALTEFYRVTRPGGYFCITESEWGYANSNVLQELFALVSLALFRTERTFSPDGRQAGIAPVLRRLVCDAGYQRVEGKADYFDYSVDSEFHDPFSKDLLVTFDLLQPFLLRSGAVAQETLEHLLQQLPAEMLSDDFSAIWPFLTIWGRKPLS